jgi:hypothetical protein
MGRAGASRLGPPALAADCEFPGATTASVSTGGRRRIWPKLRFAVLAAADAGRTGLESAMVVAANRLEDPVRSGIAQRHFDDSCGCQQWRRSRLMPFAPVIRRRKKAASCRRPGRNRRRERKTSSPTTPPYSASAGKCFPLPLAVGTGLATEWGTSGRACRIRRRQYFVAWRVGVSSMVRCTGRSGICCTCRTGRSDEANRPPGRIVRQVGYGIVLSSGWRLRGCSVAVAADVTHVDHGR